MKRFLLNISFIAALAVMVSSCVDADPDYKDFPSKDVDFTYSVAANESGEVEYGMDFYVVSHIQFTNKSSKSGNLTWDFGDGTTSTEANPIHKYEAAGTYQVKLTIDGVGSRTIPLMIYDIVPVLSIEKQSAEVLSCNDVSVSFKITIPNPENKKVKYEWLFPEGTIDASGNPLTTFTGYADEQGNVTYPGEVRFSNIGSQRIELKTTFDTDGINRRLEDSYINVQVGAPKEYKTLYYAAKDGNIKALKLIPEGELPAGTKNLPFDMGVGAGKVPYSLCCYTDEEGQSWIYILDAGKQFTYTATGETDGGDGKITVMKADGTGTNVMVTNIGGAAYNDPYYGLVDGSDLIYSDRNTGLRSMPLKTRGAKEESNYVMNNQWLGYYNKSYSYGAMSTSLYKDKAGIYWWGKCFNGNGIYRFKWSDKVDDYAKAQAPYKVVLSGVKLKGFTIDETRGHLYVWRWQSDDGFYQYPLPAADASIVAKDFTARATMIAEMGCNNADEGLYCTQMALDSETGDVYFGFNKDSGDKSIYTTGLKRFNYATSKVESIDVCGEKILGIVINDNKTKLF